MDKKICIFSNIDYFSNIPKGAVEVCNYSIIDDYIKAGYSIRVMKIPSQVRKWRMIIENIILFFKLIFSGIKYKMLVFIYPTIPFAPTTSKHKYYISTFIYSILYINKKIFNHKILVHILDYPIEQDRGLNISNINIEKRFLEGFELNLIENSDYIITYSNAFSEITINKSNQAFKKIIQLEFSPVRKHRDMSNIKLDKSIIDYIKKFETSIFYSGDLSREYEREKLSQLFENINERTCIIICGNKGEWINKNFKKININYLGYVDSNTHDAIAANCSFGLILYPNKGYYKVTPATKLSVYINSLLPILAIETETNVNIFEKYEIGECVEEDIIINRIIDWCENKTYKNYSLGIKNTFNIINSLHDMKKIKSVIERVN